MGFTTKKMKEDLKYFIAALIFTVILLPWVLFGPIFAPRAEAGAMISGWPDAISCDDTGTEMYMQIAYDDGTYIAYTAPRTGDDNMIEWFVKSTRDSDGGTNCDYSGESIDDTDYFTPYNFVATTTINNSTTTIETGGAGGYAPTQQEFMLLIGVVIFIGSIPFWERTFSVTRGTYD